MANENQIYGDITMWNAENIQKVGAIYFQSVNSDHMITTSGDDLWIKGKQGMKLWLNDNSGAVWVEECASFRPKDTESNIDLGLDWARWRSIYIGSVGLKFLDGTTQTTAAGAALGAHTHSDSSSGGYTLNPRILRMSTSSSARFRLPVGNDMW